MMILRTNLQMNKTMISVVLITIRQRMIFERITVMLPVKIDIVMLMVIVRSRRRIRGQRECCRVKVKN